MKKTFVIVICMLLLCTVGCSNNKEKEKENKPEPIKQATENQVVINLFHWNQCSHCKEEISWLKGLENKYSYLKVNYFEVGAEEELTSKIRLELNITNSSVPLTVIGTDYIIGFGGSAKAKIMNTIDKYKEFEYCDLVNLVVNNESTLECYNINNSNN